MRQTDAVPILEELVVWRGRRLQIPRSLRVSRKGSCKGKPGPHLEGPPKPFRLPSSSLPSPRGLGELLREQGLRGVAPARLGALCGLWALVCLRRPTAGLLDPAAWLPWHPQSQDRGASEEPGGWARHWDSCQQWLGLLHLDSPIWESGSWPVTSCDVVYLMGWAYRDCARGRKEGCLPVPPPQMTWSFLGLPKGQQSSTTPGLIRQIQDCTPALLPTSCGLWAKSFHASASPW